MRQVQFITNLLTENQNRLLQNNTMITCKLVIQDILYFIRICIFINRTPSAPVKCVVVWMKHATCRPMIVSGHKSFRDFKKLAYKWIIQIQVHFECRSIHGKGSKKQFGFGFQIFERPKMPRMYIIYMYHSLKKRDKTKSLQDTTQDL